MKGSTEPTVLIVEDESALSTLLRYNLEREGYRVFEAKDGEEALLLADEAKPDLVLLDWMLPQLSGIEVCRRLRGHGHMRNVPIVMLTARGEEPDRIRGLDTGADDYIVKPFRPRELRARIEAMMRRPRSLAASHPSVAQRPVTPAVPSSPSVPSPLLTGPIQVGASPSTPWLEDDVDGVPLEHRGLRLEPGARVVELEGSEVELTRSEFDILRMLLGSGRRVVSKLQLAGMLRGERGEPDHYLSEHDARAIEVHVANLRRKLGESPSEPRWIDTVRGVGYRRTA